MIVYMKCICTSKQKLLAKQLSEMGFEIRDIRKNTEWRKEAKSYGIPLPFWVKDGQPAKINL